jgi:hypothetical protein
VIESYSFGKITISGKIYTSDLIIFPDRVESTWWRKSGHTVCLEDIREILEEKFEVLILGTGFMGLMKVDEEVIRHVESNGVDLIIEKTKKAVMTYNSVLNTKIAIAALHLTC